VTDEKIVLDRDRAETFREERPEDPAIGKWYWVQEKKTRWLGCVTRIGSNYTRLEGLDPDNPTARNGKRVHHDRFDTVCTYVADPSPILDGYVETRKAKSFALMREVRELSLRLAIVPGEAALPSGESHVALAVRGHGATEAYKAALVKAEKKELPALFKAIEDENRAMAAWMSAQLIPMETQAKSLKSTIGLVHDRVFQVELYAGLVESAALIRDGEPAPATARIHLFQRRHYMDEECLVAYDAGGMTFKKIGDFDRWLAKPKNRDRILPYPRSIVAFRVRRYEHDYLRHDFEGAFTPAYVAFLFGEKPHEKDKWTFLYLRNGERLYRLDTQIDFGQELYPDRAHQDVRQGVQWAKRDWGKIESVISDDEFQALLREEKEDKAHDEALPQKDRWMKQRRHSYDLKNHYEPFVPDNLYYDDVCRFLKNEMDRHNRLVLVLQGILDRSEMLHPHPPWSLFSNNGFQAAMELVYDQSRTLVPGDAPDFELYRSMCNRAVRVGSVMTGQQRVWRKRVAEKETYKERERRTRGYESHDPGPGTVARVVAKRGDRVVFEWARGRRGGSYQTRDQKVRARMEVSLKRLFCVDAYTPGDYGIFFADPRTRSDYLKWAGLLLEAEEYHAGNRTVTPPFESKPKTEPDPGKAYEYRRRKEWLDTKKRFLGHAVRLRNDITMQSEHVYKKGTLWRVCDTTGVRQQFVLEGLEPDGSRDTDRRIQGVRVYDFVIESSIAPLREPKPKNPPKKKREDEDDDDL
jgi:hypothetical protein